MFRRRRWMLIGIAVLVLGSIFSAGHNARDEQRAYQDGYVAGQMAALAVQNGNGTVAVPPVGNPYFGYNGGRGYRDGPNGFGFLFFPLFLIGGFALFRFMRHQAWRHAAWHGESPVGHGGDGRGPWAGGPFGPRPFGRGFGRHGPGRHGGPRGRYGRGGDDRFGGGYWWREGDTPPNAPEQPVPPQPRADAGDDDTTV